MKKVLAVLFIFFGLMLMLYPKMTELYNTYMQDKLLNQWDHQTAARNTTTEESYKKLNEVFADDPDNGQQTTNSNDNNTVDSKQMIGIIQIQKINVKLPILEGASMDHLKIAAGHLEGTALPGDLGNSAIAAHRSRAYGKMFNRLDEVKIGDEVNVTDKKQTYVYKVYETITVHPDNLSVLNGNGKDRILTLITCDLTGTHRLIVHAKMESSS